MGTISALFIRNKNPTKGSKPQNGEKQSLLKNDARIKRIFSGKGGHLTDTPTNRKFLNNLANDSSKFIGKEKYGELIIYTDVINDEINKITDDIEKQSSQICEFCGKEGHTVEMKNGLGGWLKTVCSDCAAKDVFELIKK